MLCCYVLCCLLGVNYQVVIAGVTVGVYGTSCSTPVFAGLITLLNGQRKANGLNSVGRSPLLASLSLTLPCSPPPSLLFSSPLLSFPC